MTSNEIKLLLAVTRYIVMNSEDSNSPTMQLLTSLAATVRHEHNAEITAINELLTNPTKALLGGLKGDTQ